MDSNVKLCGIGYLWDINFVIGQFCSAAKWELLCRSWNGFWRKSSFQCRLISTLYLCTRFGRVAGKTLPMLNCPLSKLLQFNLPAPHMSLRRYTFEAYLQITEFLLPCSVTNIARMLSSSVTLNCQVTKNWVLNCQNCNQCLKCHISPGLSFQLSK